MQTLEELQVRLAGWYGVEPKELGLAEDRVPQGLHPVLTEFYLRFGQLAEPQSKFRPEGANSPLGTQDRIVPVADLTTENGFTEFCIENQGVFVAAASSDPKEDKVFAKGDMLDDAHLDGFAACDVDLTECLICSVLRETILSVGDRYRRITPESTRAAMEQAKEGERFEFAYLWQESPFVFYLASDVWALEWSDMEFFAHRGLWQKPRQMWQEQTFEGGGGWSSGPAIPTIWQRFVKFWTRWFQ